jgi:hypothetical protein
MSGALRVLDHLRFADGDDIACEVFRRPSKVASVEFEGLPSMRRLVTQGRHERLSGFLVESQ